MNLDASMNDLLTSKTLQLYFVKKTSLYRMKLKQNRIIHQFTQYSDLALFNVQIMTEGCHLPGFTIYLKSFVYKTCFH